MACGPSTSPVGSRFLFSASPTTKSSPSSAGTNLASCRFTVEPVNSRSVKWLHPPAHPTIRCRSDRSGLKDRARFHSASGSWPAFSIVDGNVHRLDCSRCPCSCRRCRPNRLLQLGQGDSPGGVHRHDHNAACAGAADATATPPGNGAARSPPKGLRHLRR